MRLTNLSDDEYFPMLILNKLVFRSPTWIPMFFGRGYDSQRINKMYSFKVPHFKILFFF